MVCVVIMAGGKGERFWPKSRMQKPKQFTDLTGEGTMLYLTYKRVTRLVSSEKVFVLTGQEYEEMTKQCLPELNPQNIIFEPEGRNTAPCTGLAAMILEKKYPGSTMVLVPADHLIRDEALFCQTLQEAVDLAEATKGLVTIGIRPNRPETGYGYLKLGEEVQTNSLFRTYRVESFVEKPNLEKAKQFLNEKCYLWNGGIFVWQTKVILDAFQKYMPDTYEVLRKIVDSYETVNFNETLHRLYSEAEKTSLDYGIMEKATDVYTVPGEFDWDDLGTWKALTRIFKEDNNGNLFLGNVISTDAKNCIVDTGKRLVTMVGVEDIIVVETDDITFVCHKDKTDQVRELLKEMKSQNLDDYL